MAIFREAGFDVFHGARLGKQFGLDLVASQDEREKPHVIGIEIRTAVTFRNIADVQYRARQVLDDETTNLDEVWIIVSPEAVRAAPKRPYDRRVRILSMDMVRKALAVTKASRKRSTGRRSHQIGKAIEANETAISLAIGGLILQIDDKLEGLRSETFAMTGLDSDP